MTELHHIFIEYFIVILSDRTSSHLHWILHRDIKWQNFITSSSNTSSHLHWILHHNNFDIELHRILHHIFIEYFIEYFITFHRILHRDIKRQNFIESSSQQFWYRTSSQQLSDRSSTNLHHNNFDIELHRILSSHLHHNLW